MEIGFKFALKSRFSSGIRTPVNILYIGLTLIGIGWASIAIPNINNSEISPETVGIYVIGFLVTLFLDALLAFQKAGDENPADQWIAVLAILLSILFIVISSWLSLKNCPENGDSGDCWPHKIGCYIFLGIILLISVLSSVVMTGFESKKITISVLDLSQSAIKNRG